MQEYKYEIVLGGDRIGHISCKAQSEQAARARLEAHLEAEEFCYDYLRAI